MKVTCPKCRRMVPAEQINVATDVALCPQCVDAFSLSNLVASGDADEGELGDAPRGCWFYGTAEEWEVGATTRSPMAFFLVPFMCVWSGFSLGGIYGTQILHHRFDLFSSLFGIPFVLGTLLFGSIAVMSVCGKVSVRVRNGDALIFVGVGSVGWRRHLDWLQINRVVEGVNRYRNNSGWSNSGIRLGGPARTLDFGTQVSQERLDFMMHALRRMLVKGAR